MFRACYLMGIPVLVSALSGALFMADSNPLPENEVVATATASPVNPEPHTEVAEEAEEMLIRLSALLGTAKANYQSLESDVSAEDAKVSDQIRQFDLDSTAFETNTAEHEKRIEAINNRVVKDQDQARFYASETEIASKDAEEQAKELAKTEEQLQRTERELKELRAHSQRLESALQAEEAELANLDAKVSGQRERSSTLKQKCEGRRDEIQRLLEEIPKLEKKLQELQAEISAQMKEKAESYFRKTIRKADPSGWF